MTEVGRGNEVVGSRDSRPGGRSSLERPGGHVSADIEAAVRSADLRVLLMTLVHMTGDLRWLQPPFLPVRDVRLIPEASAGLPPDVQEQIRRAALEVLRSGRTVPAIADPGDALMHRMMSVCLGEDVPPEYAPVTREEMGVCPRNVAWSTDPPPAEIARRNVLIVGAGLSGIALGAQLGRLGLPYDIVEKNDDLGGTWYENRYPGCGVDTPNHSYSFSFGARHRWTRYFSARAEIQSYLENIAVEFGVREHIAFGTRLVEARWDDDGRVWRAILDGAGGRREVTAHLLVSGIGQFNEPSIPAISGLGQFRGPTFHSARWPSDLDISGKRVAVIGTGATAMQLVPAIADEVASLVVYQRTPQWARPIAGYADLIPDGTQWLLEHMPFFAEWFRFNMFWRYGDGLLPLLRRDPDWPHPDRAINRVNDRHRQEMTTYIEEELADRPDLIGRCIPDYPPFGKRILLDNGWYRTIAKPNVELVGDPLDQVVDDGIVTTDGVHRPADVIVLATGFKMTDMAARLNIKGRGPQTLADAWDGDNPTAYLGLTVPGFPNFFCMLGPNSGLGHGGSTMFQAECQARYITACLVDMIERNISDIDVRRDVHDAYMSRVDAEHGNMIWTHPGVSTYYRNRRGRVFSVMPWRLVDYWAMTHDPRLDEYDIRGWASDKVQPT